MQYVFQNDAIFDIHILQGSVATCLKHGGIVKHDFVANLLLSPLWARVWCLAFLTHGVICYLRAEKVILVHNLLPRQYPDTTASAAFLRVAFDVSLTKHPFICDQRAKNSQHFACSCFVIFICLGS